jgi:hypothetical protein
MEVVLNAAAKENPKAKGMTVQQLLDLRFIPEHLLWGQRVARNDAGKSIG